MTGPQVKELRSEPADNVVGILEQKLEQARKGDIRAVALICIEKGDIVCTCWEMGDGGAYIQQLTVGSTHLQYRLCSEVLDD